MLKDFLCDESGSMTLEAAIITAALVALAIVFKKQLAKLWDSAGGAMHKMEVEINK